MVGDKNIEYSRVLKIELKRWGFCRFLLTRDGSVKIIKFEFDWNKAMKQIDSLRKNYC